MSVWTTTERTVEMLTEVGAYSYDPVEQPDSIERTYAYCAGWRGCIMYLQDAVREQDTTTEASVRDLIDGATLAGERMKSAFAYTHTECDNAEDLPAAAQDDLYLAVLFRFARGWIAAADKAQTRLTQWSDHIFRETKDEP